MPRPPRIHVSGGFYHAMLRGNHREDIFAVDSDRNLLNAIVQAALEKHGARIHAYCWMTNHVHLLVQVGSDPLAHLMHRIASGYARAFQANRETTGHLFEKRYHAILVDEDSYLLELLRYLHLNPVDAKLVNDVAQYRWSSHHVYSGLNVDPWVTTDFALRMFSEDRDRAIAAYQAFVERDVPRIKSPFDAISPDAPAILGGDAFIARMAESAPVPLQHVVSLEALIAQGCAKFGLRADQLMSRMRNPQIIAARAWIARTGTTRRVATMTAIARRLGCDTNTLRYAIRRFYADADSSPVED
jgi:putative transposase